MNSISSAARILSVFLLFFSPFTILKSMLEIRKMNIFSPIGSEMIPQPFVELNEGASYYLLCMVKLSLVDAELATFWATLSVSGWTTLGVCYITARKPATAIPLLLFIFIFFFIFSKKVFLLFLLSSMNNQACQFRTPTDSSSKF